MNIYFKFLKLFLVLSIGVLFLVGSGGGGDDSESPSRVYSVNAGENKTVEINQQISLTGSANFEGTYEWKEGEKVLATTKFFNYEAKTLGEHTLYFHARVPNTDIHSSALMTLTVIESNTSDGTNQAPTANAGIDKSVFVNASVKLTGVGTDSDGSIVDYEWKKGNDVLATTASFVYTPDVVGKDILILTVTDNDGDSTSDSMTVTVKKVVVGNQPPIANAGTDKSVTVNDAITITGVASDSDGSIVSYEWKKGNDVLATTASFVYTPKVVGTDTLIFTATDDEDSKSSDSMIVTVNKGTSTNKPLVLTVLIGADQLEFVDNFILKVRTDLGLSYNYNIDWGDSKTSQGITGDAQHQYTQPGTYSIKIDGNFPAFNFVPATFSSLISLDQWGSIKWKNMQGAFKHCNNLVINATDVPDFSEVNDTSSMFEDASASCYPQSMSQWDMSLVKDMNNMFKVTQAYITTPLLTQDISNWNVSNVINMEDMFYGSLYDGDFSKWNISKVDNMDNMFHGSKLSTENYDKLLISWSKLELQANVIFGANTGTQYTNNARKERKILQTKFHWTIEDGGIDIEQLGSFKPFIGIWETREYQNNHKITIPRTTTVLTVGVYQYNVDWGDGTNDTNVTESKTHTYASEGNYTISISGNYPYYDTDVRSVFGNLLDITQWGDNEWHSMKLSFGKLLKISATDAPNLSAVRDMSRMFANAQSFNSPINHWDTSMVTNMDYMFYKTTKFNQDISSWDVSKVTSMRSLFESAENFNQDISSWNVSNVIDMYYIFASATNFNQDISSWDVSKLTNMRGFFNDATSFNQDLSSWDTSNITSMHRIFKDATSFNQDLSSWNLAKNTYITLNGSNMSTTNYSNLLISMANQDIAENGFLNAGSIQYNQEAQSARFKLINQYNWTINDGGLE